MNVLDKMALIIKEILKWEGIYSNDPDDLGGETKFGITKKIYEKVKHKYALNSWETFTIDDAITIYINEYLNTTKKILENCDGEYCFNIALLHAHLSINTGPKNANKLLQQALNDCNFKLVLDGIIGPKTLKAFKSCSKARLYHEFLTRALLYYCHLNQQKFLRGWIRRILSTIFFK